MKLACALLRSKRRSKFAFRPLSVRSSAASSDRWRVTPPASRELQASARLASERSAPSASSWARPAEGTTSVGLLFSSPRARSPPPATHSVPAAGQAHTAATSSGALRNHDNVAAPQADVLLQVL